MSDTDRKPESNAPDPDAVMKLIEIELIQKRAAWQRARANRGPLRALAFLFLFIVVAGTLLAYFYFFSNGSIQELSKQPAHSPTPTASDK